MQAKNRLKFLRTQAGMTVAELAKATGISATSISRQETLTRTIPTETALVYCDYFGCTMDYFFCRETNNQILNKYSSSDLEEFLKIIELELKKRKARL